MGPLFLLQTNKKIRKQKKINIHRVNALSLRNTYGALPAEKSAICRRLQHSQHGFPTPEVTGKASLRCEVTPKSHCCSSLYQRAGEGLSIARTGLFARGLRSVCTARQIAMYELTARYFHRSLFKGDLARSTFCFHLFLIGFAHFCFLVKYEYIRVCT